MARVLCIPDNQAPFGHQDAIPFLRAAYKHYRCTHIVHLGDEADFHALSDYKHDPDGYSAGHELEAALAELREYYRYFPTVKVCISNHTARPLRKAFSSGIPRKFLRDYKEFLEAPPGWEWRDHWEIDGVRYEHGDSLFARGSGGTTTLHRGAVSRGQSVVFGHIHSVAGLQWIRTSGGGRFFAMCVGCLVDEDAYAFRYHKGPSNSQLGCGVVLDGIPQYIPMQVNKRNRWTGKI